MSKVYLYKIETGEILPDDVIGEEQICAFVYDEDFDINKIEGECPLFFKGVDDLAKWISKEGEEYVTDGQSIVIRRLKIKTI